MLEEVDVNEARKLSLEIAEALGNLFEGKKYPMILASLEMLQLDLVLHSVADSLKEDLISKVISKEAGKVALEMISSKLLLDMTMEVLSAIEYEIVLPEEIH